MKKFKNSQSIGIFLATVLFVTTLSVFLSFVIEPRNLIESNEKDDVEIINIDLSDEFIETEKINSIIEMQKIENDLKIAFSKKLIKLNLPIILNEAIDISNEINYSSSQVNSKIWFKILNYKEVSIKLELFPKNNYSIKFNSKFRLIIK